MATKKNADPDKHVQTAMDVLSPSGFNTYKACPFKFYLTYRMGIREPGTKATYRGTLVHKVCEELIAFKISGMRSTWKMEVLAEAQRLFDYRWGRYKSLHNEPEAFKQQTWMMVKNFALALIANMEGMVASMPNFALKSLWTMSKPRSEEKLDLKKQHKLHGTADLIMDGEEVVTRSDYVEFVEKSPEESAIVQSWFAAKDQMEELTIADIKTSKIYKLAFSNEYKVQLMFYALLFWLKHERMPTYAAINFVAYGIQAYFEIIPDHVYALHEEIKTLQLKCVSDYDSAAAWPADTDSTFCKWCWMGKATYNAAGQVIKPAECVSGWKKWSEDGTVVHGKT